MRRSSIHIRHGRADTHWLAPDPAWSRYSFGLDFCIRDEDPRGARPLADAVAGAAARVVQRLRGRSPAGA